MSKSKSSAPVQTKRDQIISMLRSHRGASLTEIIDATGWLPHTARARLTGLRKEGFRIDKANSDGVTRYSIATEPSA